MPISVGATFQLSCADNNCRCGLYLMSNVYKGLYKRSTSFQYCGDGHGASGFDFADALRFLGTG